MSIQTITTWRNTFADIPLVATQLWKQNWADWIESNVSGMKLAGYTPLNNVNFTFSKSTFASTLIDSVPGVDARINLANAYEAAVLASTMLITPPLTSPAFTAVTSCIVDPASIVVGKTKILTTDITQVITDAKNATIVQSFYDAFKALTYTVVGVIGGNPTTLPAQGVI